MTDKQLIVTAKPGNGIEYYEIEVRRPDNTVDVLGRNGDVASIDLKTPGKYLLLWYVLGEAESKLELEVVIGGVKWPKITAIIPKSDHGDTGAGAGSAPFELVP